MKTKNTPDVKPHNFTHDGSEVLILRRVGKDRISKNNFYYPEGVGQTVEAPDWNDRNECGGGLHGWPWGFGLGEGMSYDLDDVWLILGAKPEDVVGELDGGWKCKCRRATIRYDGTFDGAMNTLRGGFNEAERTITIPGHISKTRVPRRIDGLPDALWHWLATVKDRGATVSPARFRQIGRLGREALELKSWPKDVTRHTFASYAVHAFKDPGKVALWLRHEGDQSLLYRHYMSVNVSEADAIAFFALRP